MNQRNDLKITFSCPDQWEISAKQVPTVYTAAENMILDADPSTCKLRGDINNPYVKKVLDGIDKKHNDNGSNTWDRVRFTLLSMLISSSFLASFNITTFYTGVSVVVGGMARKMFINLTFMSWQFETTNPDVIIKLIEYIVQKRHEMDLVGEEEGYRML